MGIFSALHIERDERVSVVLIVLQSLFIGIFAGAFDIGAHTLFLQAHGEHMIANAYLVSGLVGIVLTAIYSKLQATIRFSRLAAGNLFVIGGITLALYFGFEILEPAWTSFIVFVMLGPLYILSIIGFWGMAGRLFNLRQGKRLFGILDTGQILGMIIVSFTVPLLSVVFQWSLPTDSLLLIGGISLGLALFLQIIISKKFDLDKSSEELKTAESEEIVIEDVAPAQQHENEKSNLVALFKRKYTRHMALFIILSMVAAFFVQFSFMVVTQARFPEEESMVNFLGAFTGATMIVTLLVKTFLFGRMLKTYGLKVSLLMLPILLGLFILLACVIGSIYGFTPEAGGFTLFFMMIALGKLFAKTLKDAIEIPSFKLLYQSLHKKIRHTVQARMDGTVNEMAAVLSGVLLVVLGLLSFIVLIHYSFILFGIIIIWIGLTFKLYSSYKKSLEESLESSTTSASASRNFKPHIRDVLTQQENNGSADKKIYTLNISRELQHLLHESMLLQGLDSNEKKLRQYAILHAGQGDILSAAPMLEERIKEEKEEELRNEAVEALAMLKKELDFELSGEELVKLSKSRDTKERFKAARFLGMRPSEEYHSTLTFLLRDFDPTVRKKAIRSALQFRSPEAVSLLIEYLANPHYSKDVSAVLAAYGEEVLPDLERTFYRSGLTKKVLMHIIRLYGQIGSPKAIPYLMDKIGYHSREVMDEVVNSLHLCGFEPTEQNSIRISDAIKQVINQIGWNYALKGNPQFEEFGPMLGIAIDEELHSNSDRLYSLLALIYDRKSVQHVKENIESGTVEGIGYAIELLDLFIAEDLKPLVFPVLEDISLEDKVRALQNFYALEVIDSPDILVSILNRDLNYISNFSKACALYGSMEREDVNISEDVLAHLFNNDLLLRETTALLVHTHAPEMLNTVLERVEDGVEDELRDIIAQVKISKSHMIIEKILFLKALPGFGEVSGRTLSEIATDLVETHEPAGRTLLTKENRWTTPIFFIVRGSARLENSEGTIGIFNDKQPLGDFLIYESDNASTKVVTDTSTHLYSIDKTALYAHMYNHPSVLKIMIALFHNREEQLLEKEGV